MKVISKFLPVLFVLISFSFIEPANNAQQFEGEILYKNKSGRDINFTRYYVKDNFIRVEDLDSKMRILSYRVIEFKPGDTAIDYVNPNRNIYKHERYIPLPPSGFNQKYLISRTGNSKLIMNEKCFQWQVTNVHQNTVVTYWLSTNGVSSFGDIAKILNTTERTSFYYLHIPKSNSNNIFPMEIEELSLLRDKRVLISIQKMEKKKLKKSFFTFHKRYKKVK